MDFAIIDAAFLLKQEFDQLGDAEDDADENNSEEACSIPNSTDEIAPTKDSEVKIRESESAHDPWAINGCQSDQCDIFRLNAVRGCKSHNYNTIHNETAWIQMRATYIATVGPRKSTIKGVHGSGMQVQYKVGHSPGRGRGIYATERIPKGTVVWKAEYTAAFSNGIQFRRFLASLPDVIACDLINWCYTSRVSFSFPQSHSEVVLSSHQIVHRVAALSKCNRMKTD